MMNEVMNIKELCVYLDTSEKTIKNLMKDEYNPLPYCKLTSSNRYVRFIKEDIIEWLRSKEVKGAVKESPLETKVK